MRLPVLYALLPLLISSASAEVVLYENARDGSPLIPLINSARETLDIEIYEMGDPAVQYALLHAASDGVRVRILVEPTPVGGLCEIFLNASATADSEDCRVLRNFKFQLERLGGKFFPFNKALCGLGSGGRFDDETGGCVQHGKIAIADRADAILSTGNFNSVDLCNLAANPRFCQRDYTVSVRTPFIVDDLQSVFDFDWIGIPYDLPHSLPRDAFNALSISPFSLPPLVEFILSARKSIEIQEQYLNDPTMNQALIDIAKKGKVAVKIMVSSFCAFGKPSAILVKRATDTYTNFEAAGAQVMTFPSAILIRGKPGYLHAKAIIVDGREAWVGSVNGSTQSLTRNREFGIFFSDPVAVRRLRASFAKDFADENAETWQESLDCLKDHYRL